MDWYGVSVLKKLSLVFVILFTSLLIANEEARELRIRILGALAHTVTGKSLPYVYLDEPNIKNLDTKKYGFILIQQCKKADVIFTHKADTILKECPTLDDKMLFTLSYRDYITHEEQAIGAFFWQKGRPNIILNKRLIQHYHIQLPQEYDKYVE